MPEFGKNFSTDQGILKDDLKTEFVTKLQIVEVAIDGWDCMWLNTSIFNSGGRKVILEAFYECIEKLGIIKLNHYFCNAKKIKIKMDEGPYHTTQLLKTFL